MEIKKVLIISGPTGTGKTRLSIQLARNSTKKYEVVNFDSLLFYKELNIGTAKPRKNELEEIPHHMINISSISEPINAADYCRKVIPIIDEIHSRNKVPILVGGSGFYLRALIQGMYPTLTPNKAVLEKSNTLYKEQGIEPFWSLLQEVDPISAKKLHINDHYRVRRAIEFYWTSRYPISEAPSKQSEIPAFYKTKGWELLHIYLNIPKEQHYSLIEKRASQMINDGLVQEVQDILNQGFTGQEKPLLSIGYKETLQRISGEIKTDKELQERIFIATRRLAKAQRTWFQSISNKYEYNLLHNEEEAIAKALSF